MNRRSKKNSFTDALGEEISTRKVLGKAAKAKKKAEDEIFLSEVDSETINEDELIAEPFDPVKFYQAQVVQDEKPKPSKNKKSSAKKSDSKAAESPKKISAKKSAAKLSETAKKISLPVEAESDFERRIFAEADNDFFDEKPLESIGDNMRSISKEKAGSRTSSFRSRILAEKAAEKNSAEENDSPDFDPELHRKLTRAELAGVAISAMMLFYSFVNLDKPLFFLSLSLFTHLIRPLIGAFCGKYNRSVQNGLRSFSLVLFVGALVLLFTNS